MVHTSFQPMDPRFRMQVMQQQRPQMMPGQQQLQQQQQPLPQQALQQQQQQGVQQPGMPSVSESSPLLAQQLSGGGGGQPGGASAAEGVAADGASTDELGQDLNDLGVPDEELLGMADDFDFTELADALDENESNNTNILDDLNAEEDEEAEKKEGAGQPPPPPPPYTQANNPGTQRGPPPPYPGPAKQVRKKNHNLTVTFLSSFQII